METVCPHLLRGILLCFYRISLRRIPRVDSSSLLTAPYAENTPELTTSCMCICMYACKYLIYHCFWVILVHYGFDRSSLCYFRLTAEGVDSLIDLINGSVFSSAELDFTRHANDNSNGSSSYFIVKKNLDTTSNSSSSNSNSGRNHHIHQSIGSSKRAKTVTIKEGEGTVHSRLHFSDILF